MKHETFPKIVISLFKILDLGNSNQSRYLYLRTSDLNTEKSQIKKGMEMNHVGLFSHSFSLPNGSWTTSGFFESI